MGENAVPLNPGLGGAEVRTAEVTELQSGGALLPVEQQYVVLADIYGQPIDFGKITQLLSEIAASNQAILKRVSDGL